MLKNSENPAELHEIVRRPISDGEVVLKAAGIGGVHRVQVEVLKDGHSEIIPIPVRTDAFKDAWETYANHGEEKRPRQAA